MNRYPKTIALTGGIGSGKTQVINILKSLGEQTLCCDEITLNLYEKQEIIEVLAKMFPTCYDSKTNKMDKSKISKLVFEDKRKLKKLTDFLTPLVLEECLLVAKSLAGRVFIEVPLLFECASQDRFDKVVVITRDLNDRISSIMKRNNLTKNQTLKRIASQFNYGELDTSKYVILKNDSSLENLKIKVENLLKSLD